MTFANLRQLCTIYAGPTHMQLCLVNSLAKHENLQKAKSCFCKIQIMNLVWIMKFNWYKRKGRGLSLCFNTTLMFVTSSHVSDWPLPVHNVSNKKRLHHSMGEPAIAHISLQPRNSVYPLSEVVFLFTWSLESCLVFIWPMWKTSGITN